MIQRAVDVQQRMYTYSYLHVVHLRTTVYYFYNKGRYVPLLTLKVKQIFFYIKG